MKLVVQRVLQAEVQVDGQSIGKINRGLLVFVGVGKEDTKEIADKYLKKLLGLRIFEDETARQIFLSRMWTEKCFWSLSLHCMRTVRRETDQALLRRGTRQRQKLYMNI